MHAERSFYASQLLLNASTEWQDLTLIPFDNVLIGATPALYLFELQKFRDGGCFDTEDDRSSFRC